MVPDGFKVHLKFQDFQLRDDSCRWDYVKIWDGPDEESNLIDTYCGFEKHKDIASTTNQLYIQFHSSHYGQYRGFNITFSKGECKFIKYCL